MRLPRACGRDLGPARGEVVASPEIECRSGLDPPAANACLRPRAAPAHDGLGRRLASGRGRPAQLLMSCRNDSRLPARPSLRHVAAPELHEGSEPVFLSRHA